MCRPHYRPHSLSVNPYLGPGSFHDVLSRNRNLLLKAITTYVRPNLEYFNLVWSCHNKYFMRKLEYVQKFFTKRLPGLWNVPDVRRLGILTLQSSGYRLFLLPGTSQLLQEAHLMLTTGSTRLAVSRGQQTWYHSTCYI